MTLQTKTARGAGGDLAARDGTRRAALSYPNSTLPPQNCQIVPPDHLTPTERELWTAAERAKGTDYARFCNLRRQLLLAQAARWEVTR